MSGGDDRCAEPERFDAFASEKGAWLQVHGRAGMSHEPPEVDPGLDRNVAEPGAVRPRRCDTVFDNEHVFAGEASDDPGSQVGYVGSALGRIGFIGALQADSAPAAQNQDIVREPETVVRALGGEQVHGHVKPKADRVGHHPLVRGTHGCRGRADDDPRYQGSVLAEKGIGNPVCVFGDSDDGRRGDRQDGMMPSARVRRRPPRRATWCACEFCGRVRPRTRARQPADHGDVVQTVRNRSPRRTRGDDVHGEPVRERARDRSEHEARLSFGLPPRATEDQGAWLLGAFRHGMRGEAPSPTGGPL